MARITVSAARARPVRPRPARLRRLPAVAGAAVLAAWLLSGCAATAPMRGEFQSQGVASYYGREFKGRRTASGERFDPKALTAAHPTLEFGTRVRVTNLDNGRSVVVRINDRGPFKKGRIIDVSRGAARALGFVRDGTARVRLEILGG